MLTSMHWHFIDSIVGLYVAEGESMTSPNRNYSASAAGSANSVPAAYSFLSSQPSGSSADTVVSSIRAGSLSNASSSVKTSGSNSNEPSRSAGSSSSGNARSSNGTRSETVSSEASNKSSRTAHENNIHSAITRSRSPPVVTIAPTLSMTGLHYQDSRKVTMAAIFVLTWLFNFSKLARQIYVMCTSAPVACNYLSFFISYCRNHF